MLPGFCGRPCYRQPWKTGTGGLVDCRCDLRGLSSICRALGHTLPAKRWRILRRARLVHRRCRRLGGRGYVGHGVFGRVDWWHPLAHLAVRQLRAESEALCDAAALETEGGSARAYVQILLDFTVHPVVLPPAAPAMFGGRGHPLTQRVQRLLAPTGPSGRLWRLLLGAALAAGLAVLCGFSGKKPPPIPPATSASESQIRWSANPFPDVEKAE
jgi:hypothetical protein